MAYQVGRINGPALADNLQREGTDTFAFETTLLVIDGTNGTVTTSGALGTSASTTSRAGINIPVGVAPTTPNDGDIWVTASGLNIRINGASVISGDVFATGSPLNNQLAHWTDSNTIDGDSTLTWSGTVLDITGNITLSGTVDGIDIATDVAANTAKITNATHTGQVTGATALSLAVTAITDQPAAGVVVGADTLIINDGGVLSEVTATQLATFTNATAGDVTKVATPVDNEIGVWTGDGTIEGDTNLTWDGSILIVTGNLSVSGSTVFTISTLANSATPSVSGGRIFLTGGTTAITDLTNGAIGQEIIILAEATITITDNGNFFLAGFVQGLGPF